MTMATVYRDPYTHDRQRARAPDAGKYLWPALKREIGRREWRAMRAFDLGCGGGATANIISQLGFSVTGVDPSETRIADAQRTFPHINCEQGSAYDDLSEKYGTYPLVVSLEVIEHCFYPRLYARTVYSLLEPGGVAIISTPYHGYLKNLALAAFGKMDEHFSALIDGGHIKFLSISTLAHLLQEAGFRDISILRVGRIPPIAKSMIAVCVKDSS